MPRQSFPMSQASAFNIFIILPIIPKTRNVFSCNGLMGAQRRTVTACCGEDMDLPGYNASAAIREIKDQGFKEKTPYRSIHSALDRETAPVMAAPHRKLENILLDEFDRQEELYHSLISKMDESSELGRRIIDENKQIMVCIRENTEMLQSLKEDMEQIKQYAKQLKSEGLLRRFFYRGS